MNNQIISSDSHDCIETLTIGVTLKNDACGHASWHMLDGQQRNNGATVLGNDVRDDLSKEIVDVSQCRPLLDVVPHSLHRAARPRRSVSLMGHALLLASMAGCMSTGRVRVEMMGFIESPCLGKRMHSDSICAACGCGWR
jgi:hypothetical protein